MKNILHKIRIFEIIKLSYVKTIIFIFIIFQYSETVFSQNVLTWYNVYQNNQTELNSMNQNYIVGNNGLILRNGGLNNFQIVNANTYSNLNSISANSNYIAGDNGVLLRVNLDTIILYNSPTSDDILSFFYGDFSLSPRLRNVIFTKTGKIYWKTLTGSEWYLTYSNPEIAFNFADVLINVNRSFCFAACNNGLFLRSVNSLNSWNLINTGTIENLNFASFSDTVTGYIVGNNGVFMKTTNGGNNWISIPIGYTNNLNYVNFSGNIGVITGSNGLILRSSNSGNTWIKDSTGFSHNVKRFLGNTILTSGGNIFKRFNDSLYLPNEFVSGNNIKVHVNNRGIIGNGNSQNGNRPGFEYPANSNKHVSYASGLNISAYFQNELRMIATSYVGEYKPGYTENGIFKSDNRFKFYKVKRTDYPGISWDYDNWHLMIPFGAPFHDVNNNGIYEPTIDKPGIKNAEETIFIALTDSDSSTHLLGEGFGGGTNPLFCDLGLTLWTYNTPLLQNVVFIKHKFINKSPVVWQDVKFGYFNDSDVGDGSDDYTGVDSVLKFSYTYNVSNIDATYGNAPPAFGLMFLKTPGNSGMTSGVPLPRPHQLPPCIGETYVSNNEARNMLLGLKKDGSTWKVHRTNPLIPTKFVFPGDPETHSGWVNSQGFTIDCIGSNVQIFDTLLGGNIKLIMNTSPNSLNISPGNSTEIISTQFVARGSSNLNSVTKLKQLADSIRIFFDGGNVINISSVTNELPSNFELFQNYPNPFNPETTIKFNVPEKANVSLEVFDVAGRFIEGIKNIEYNPGSYEFTFYGSNLSSGIYFYRLTSNKFSQTKKMILLK
ncbi:MAG: T9SS type A sorting domain-containing protein [Ignavibacteria bacterium]|nr:T9SS type A sorting domain-containing protein [Ignavibacteria bacterium]